MIPPRPSKAPARKPSSAFEPNRVFLDEAELDAWIQMNMPGAKVVEVYKVEMLRCKVISPERKHYDWPFICQAVNLYGFKTEKEMEKFNEENCGHMPMLAKWQCKVCGLWHYWGTAATGNQGDFLAGSLTIRPHLRKILDTTAKAGTVKTFERE